MISPPLNSSLSPNTEPDDVASAAVTLCMPHTWKKGDAIGAVRRWFQDRFGVGQENIHLFNSGRAALYAILSAFGVGDGDEVIVQAFTCVAVPNSVRWTGATPVFVDINPKTYNIDTARIKKAITKKTKAIIVQHTFGIPGDLDAIGRIAKTHNILVIEDCAHALGATYKNERVGTKSDAAFFSFGRDKVISSVFGGAGYIADTQPQAQANLRASVQSMPYPSYAWIAQQLMHPLMFAIIMPVYSISVGKLFLELAKRFNIISIPVEPEECRGDRPQQYPQHYPNAMARLLLRQLDKLDRYNQTRKSASTVYRSTIHSSGASHPVDDSGAIWLRYPIEVDDPTELYHCAKRRGVLLGRWYSHVIDPKTVDCTAIGYDTGSCPMAERAAQRIVNLPTRLSLHQAKRVVNIINSCVGQ